MYQDLKQRYWWYGMKKDVAAHLALCDVCQRVKAEYQRPVGLLQPLQVLSGNGKRLVWISLWDYPVLVMGMILYGLLWIG
jgi:hypothetical protein